MTEFFRSKKGLLILGLIGGILTAILAATGNPKNMALCVACFVRDSAGALKLHSAATVQYFRPEIVGIVGGSFLLSLFTKEYRSTGGSSPAIRFLLGVVMMIGALIFLGCPLRMVLRMSAGDLNAWVALIGFAAGIITGACFLKKGFSLGRSYDTNVASGMVMPILLVLALIVSLATALFAASTEGPGSMHAPVILALVISLIFGALAQRSRMCFGGSIRDIFLMRDGSLICVIAGLFISMLIYNVVTGNFNLSFADQPIAHTEHLWNILGMYVVGFAAVLAGGCPLRQLVLTGQGSSDSACTFVGMLLGAAFAHNFGLASSGAGTTSAGRIVCIICIVILFIIAAAGLKKSEA
jgi:hypothetical protein